MIIQVDKVVEPTHLKPPKKWIYDEARKHEAAKMVMLKNFSQY